MNKQVNFGHILGLLSVFVIPLLIWGINVERRFEHVIINTKDINTVTGIILSNQKRIQDNHDEVMTGLHIIELQVKDKKDRD